MKVIVVTATALLVAGAAHAQTPSARTPPPQAAPTPPVSSLTRDLNSGPPAAAVYLAPAPVTGPAPAPTERSAPPAIPPALTSPRPATAVEPLAAPAVAPPARVVATPALTPSPSRPAAPLVAAPTPIASGSRPATSVITAPAPASAAPAPITPAPAPAGPAITVLDAAARAALPFTADLPPGFEIVTGRPGPDFRIYTVRRGAQSFVMVYAGPASQFPIYSGQMVEAGGRASVVSTEDGVRHAMEHLFQRATAPAEIHIWTMSLDGADRVLAEEIAQSVDVR